MTNKIVRIFSLFLVVGIVLYIVLLNQNDITVFLTPGQPISRNAGAVLIVSFLLGVLFTSIIGFYFGIKSRLRERSLNSRERQRLAFYDGMLKARGFLATEEWKAARATWEQIVKKDPTDIIARVELSRSLQGSGEIREALKVLEAARAASPQNVEVLFRAAELNLEMNNKTAAIDNLALILYHHPNQKAAILARQLSEELERYDDALEYQAQLENIDSSSIEASEARNRLEFKKILKDAGEDNSALEVQLRQFVRKKPEFVPALHKLANVESQRGKLDEAAQLLVKAAKASGSSVFWNEAAKLWINNRLPDRAVSAARSATKDLRGQARLEAELDLIRTYISLNMLDDARRSIDGFQSLARTECPVVPRQISQDYLVLKGLCLNRQGLFRESAEIWKQLSEYDFSIKESLLERQVAVNGTGHSNAPSPTLSTP